MANLRSCLAPLLKKVEICAQYGFCRNFNIATTFEWSIFRYNQYFWQRSAIKWTHFPIPMHYVKIDKSLVTPSSTPEWDKDLRLLRFCRKFNCIQFLFKVFVNIICTFGRKSTENKGLISTAEKSIQNPHTVLKEVKEIWIFEKKKSLALHAQYPESVLDRFLKAFTWLNGRSQTTLNCTTRASTLTWLSFNWFYTTRENQNRKLKKLCQ